MNRLDPRTNGRICMTLRHRDRVNGTDIIASEQKNGRERHGRVTRSQVGVLATWFQTFVFSAGISWITLSVPTLSTTLPQNILPPRGTSWVGVSKITLPLPSGAPSVNTSERNGPICRGGKLTTPMTSLPSSSYFV